jgi:hypothetical protein
VLRFFRRLGIDGTLVWVLVGVILPAYAATMASRKSPLWLLAIVPWAITWGYPIGLFDNPFQDGGLWPIGPLVYAASVLTVVEITTENSREYVARSRSSVRTLKQHDERSDR